ncbi:hypothetical protein [Pontibacter sp. HSC-36F09]|uniref:hypothetical protein n=1 Tax=Pontibacter sp. HSC-36F09 TaxID=2910966 RepID=UPI00209E8BE8|nr:hypothetical protein [Pontibacter sp. HSC-36F09]MCP2043052.1 hypothetical protein [Pontibacter sp. HSC-36F09]
MLKKWKSLSVTAGLATILLLGVTTTPNAADLNNGEATTIEATAAVAPDTNVTVSTDEAKPETPKKQKSVLDADMLESPLSFFKDLSSGSEEEEESSDLTVRSSTIVLALKALAATLLSTIM